MRACFGVHRWADASREGTVAVADLGTLRADLHSFRVCERCGKTQMFMGENWYTIAREAA